MAMLRVTSAVNEVQLRQPSVLVAVAAPLDALMTHWCCRLEPAALEASLAFAADLETERAALDLERHVAGASAIQRTTIRNLARDLPILWKAETTTQEERQTTGPGRGRP